MCGFVASTFMNRGVSPCGHSYCRGLAGKGGMNIAHPRNFRPYRELATTVDGRNPAPVEVGGISHFLQGFSTIPGGCSGFLPSKVSLLSSYMRPRFHRHEAKVKVQLGSQDSIFQGVYPPNKHRT